jgi:Transposase DDE domain group 1
MDNAQVAVAQYCPDWWPANTALLIRRVLLDPSQVSADPRSRRRRPLHPDQRALPVPELARAGAIYAYSFIVTNLDVSTPSKAAAVEHWYRHRTTVENLFRDGKLGAALRHLPSGYPQVNMAWLWGALLAASMAAWLHQLTGTALGEDIVHGHGVRGGKAMIATLRWRLIAVPGRLTRHARHLVLRLPPGHYLLPGVLTGCGNCQHRPDPRTQSPRSPSLPAADQPRSAETYPPAKPALTRAASMRSAPNSGLSRSFAETQLVHALLAESGQITAVTCDYWLSGRPSRVCAEPDHPRLPAGRSGPKQADLRVVRQELVRTRAVRRQMPLTHRGRLRLASEWATRLQLNRCRCCWHFPVTG